MLNNLSSLPVETKEFKKMIRLSDMAHSCTPPEEGI
jgi:hypothetical protein